MSDQSDRPPVPEGDDEFPPPEFPPLLQAALRNMSRRGPVVNMGSGEIVAEDGRMATDKPGEGLVACAECARAIALGWWGSISRHAAPSGRPVCVLCSEGEATLTAVDWFALAAALVAARTTDGQRRSWHDDAVKGLGAVSFLDGGEGEPPARGGR